MSRKFPAVKTAEAHFACVSGETPSVFWITGFIDEVVGSLLHFPPPLQEFQRKVLMEESGVEEGEEEEASLRIQRLLARM